MTENKRIIFPCLIIVIMMLSIIGNFKTLGAEESAYDSVIVLLNRIKSAHYRYSTSEGDSGEIGFKMLEEDFVNGEATWKVEWTYAEDMLEPQTWILWISKSTGKCLKANFEDETYTGDLAQFFGSNLLNAWSTWVASREDFLDFDTERRGAEAGYGRFIYLGSEVQTFGSTQLLTYKYRWEGYSDAPPVWRGIAEYWYAPVSFGNIIVRIYFESEDGEQTEYRLLLIEFINPEPVSTPTPTSTPEPTPIPTQTPEETSTPTPAPPTTSGESPWLLVIGIAAVIIVAFFTVSVLFLKRKRMPPPPPP
ncbi:MAG: hypothetical protein QXJ72_08260 [Thermoproteota archaeon]